MELTNQYRSLSCPLNSKEKSVIKVEVKVAQTSAKFSIVRNKIPKI